MTVTCAGPWFSVEAKNEERGGPGLSYLRKLYITVNGITVTLMKSRRTLVCTVASTAFIVSIALGYREILFVFST